MQDVTNADRTARAAYNDAAPDRGRTDDPLDKALASTAAEVARLDGKASSMLTASSLVAAILVGVVPTADLSGPVAALVGLGILLNVAATVAVLLVIRSRFGRPETTRGSFLHWATLAPEELVEELCQDRRAAQTVTLSRIARGKHRLVRLAVDLTVAAAGVLAVSLLVALF
ncbi:Pycsar system effector family protein [Streptomyces sp. NRRL F-5065]|uniref:Pycsar system effector family protein n=1 Tax=Streptomyces sp. NRRL F-5065 TaxID=1463855 RepID=UPI000B1BAD12|nr:Pycsar system effector family protein [Streptomyces sp. NRRL F-5065]